MKPIRGNFNAVALAIYVLSISYWHVLMAIIDSNLSSLGNLYKNQVPLNEVVFRYSVVMVFPTLYLDHVVQLFTILLNSMYFTLPIFIIKEKKLVSMM